jgi:hypothetical protein
MYMVLTFFVVVGAATTGIALGLAWMYLRGELQMSLVRHEDPDDVDYYGRP